MTASRTDSLARLIAVADIPTDRPIVTLDVDGVLNAYDHGLEPSPYQPKMEDSPKPYDIDRSGTMCLPYEPTGTYGHVSKREYLIQWSDGLMTDIARLADKGEVTLLWLTSWQDEAGLLAAEMLWPGRTSPVLGYVDAKGDDERCTYASKRLAMKGICDAMAKVRPDDPLPVVSFDDDMPWDAMAWGGGVEFPGFFHGIGTDPRFGITKSQWEWVRGILGATDEMGDATDGDADGICE